MYHLQRRRVCQIAMAIAFMQIAAAPTLDRYPSRHFQVATDVSRGVVQPIVQHMDGVYGAYRSMFPNFAPRNSQRADFYILSGQLDYLNLLASYGINGNNTGGIFFSSTVESGLATWVNDRSQHRLKQVLQHEGFHQFAQMHIGGAFPTWTNEGLAEYFGYGLLVKGRLETGLLPSHPLLRVQAAIRDTTTLPFDDLLRMTGAEWNRRLRLGDARAGVAYDQSWSVVHFLLNAQRGKYRKAFLSFIDLTSSGMDIDNSLTRAFGSTEFSAFERAWKKQTLALTPDPLSVMVERLDFLAEGIRVLERSGTHVETLEQLKQALIELKFNQTLGSHLSKWVLSASDEEIYRVPVPVGRQKPAVLRLVPPKKKGNWPTLEVSGLRAQVRTIWQIALDGQPVSDVVIR